MLGFCGIKEGWSSVTSFTPAGDSLRFVLLWSDQEFDQQHVLQSRSASYHVQQQTCALASHVVLSLIICLCTGSIILGLIIPLLASLFQKNRENP